jgi:DTW domain-containing protein YfiP
MDESCLTTIFSEKVTERPSTRDAVVVDQNTYRCSSSSPSTTVGDGSVEQRRRACCQRCHRPTPQTCICEALPAQHIRLSITEVVILQHPLEIKQHKATANRSVPLLELCLAEEGLHLCVGRRLGDDMDQTILHKLHDSVNYQPVLVFPKLNTDILSSKTNNIFSLTQLISKLKQDTKLDYNTITANTSTAAHDISQSPTIQTTTPDSARTAEAVATTTIPPRKKKILLLVLDATWKYAREMHMANQKYHQYPSHMFQVALEKEDLQFYQKDSSSYCDQLQQPRRFDIRGKVSNTGGKKAAHQEDTETTWMCTAECVSLIVSRLEEELGAMPHNTQQLHETLMKPLDVMVAKWRAFVTSPKVRKHDLERGMSKKEKRKRLLQEKEETDKEQQQQQVQENQSIPPISR